MTNNHRHAHLLDDLESTNSATYTDRHAEGADPNSELAEHLSTRYGGVSIFAVVMLLLAIAIIWSGAAVATQTQRYRHRYQDLQTLKNEHHKLQIEQQRLLIEQQTFSATPQIAARAVAELKMYSPTLADKIILTPNTPPQGVDLMQLGNKPNSDNPSDAEVSHGQ